MPGDEVTAFPEIAAVRLISEGEKAAGFEHIQNFLTRFGYLQEGVFQAGELDAPTLQALARYQEFNGLKTTGDFNQATRDQMTTPRCALPDMRLGVVLMTTCAWNQLNLTYAFDSGTRDIPRNNEWQAVRRAFRTWQAVIPIRFTEVSINENPDIQVGWRPANDPDLSMVGGTLAHADFPPGCGVVTNDFPKPIHFDDSEHFWSIGAAPGVFDVETVALHEIGHILGLAHSSVVGAVMLPSISANSTKRIPTQDDIDGVQALYPDFLEPGAAGPEWD
jgi:matrixin/putative peptidoglycan binding protein